MRAALLLLLVVAAGCKPRVPLPVGGLPRFADLNDGTVRDNATSLVWTRSANVAAGSGPYDGLGWSEALGVVADMNVGRRPNFGHEDWRLPCAEELQRLVAAFWVPGSAMACFANDLDPPCTFRVPSAPFTGALVGGHWSATTAVTAAWATGRGPCASGAGDADARPDAWMIDTWAHPLVVGKTGRGRLWPVRGTCR